MNRIARSMAAFFRWRHLGRGYRMRSLDDQQGGSRYSVGNNQIEEIMLKSAVFASLVVASLIAIPVASEVRPVAPESAPAISNILPVQGRWEHCRYVRERIREAEARLAYAPPWERPRIERRLWEAREE